MNQEGWKLPTGDWQEASLAGLDPSDQKQLVLHAGSGILANGPKGHTQNLLSKVDHGDCQLHVEFLIPKGGNSGVYLMARYEVQIFDSWGRREVRYSDCGGIYQWDDPVTRKPRDGQAPMVNACKPPGEWQTLDITFRAPRFSSNGNKTESARFEKVILNGQDVQNRVEVAAPTRAAMFHDEKPTGPLMLQGDHGPVAYRNVSIHPLHNLQ